MHRNVVRPQFERFHRDAVHRRRFGNFQKNPVRRRVDDGFADLSLYRKPAFDALDGLDLPMVVLIGRQCERQGSAEVKTALQRYGRAGIGVIIGNRADLDGGQVADLVHIQRHGARLLVDGDAYRPVRLYGGNRRPLIGQGNVVLDAAGQRQHQQHCKDNGNQAVSGFDWMKIYCVSLKTVGTRAT